MRKAANTSRTAASSRPDGLKIENHVLSFPNSDDSAPAGSFFISDVRARPKPVSNEREVESSSKSQFVREVGDHRGHLTHFRLTALLDPLKDHAERADSGEGILVLFHALGLRILLRLRKETLSEEGEDLPLEVKVAAGLDDLVDGLRMKNMKSDMKKVTMIHSIGIMKDHGRSETEIKEMLKDRFFVSADEAEALIKEAEQKEAENNEPLKTDAAES